MVVGGSPFPHGDSPTIVVANHPAWWDPIVGVFLARDVFGRDAYGIMDRAQLARFPFFRRVGCFSAGDTLSDVRALAEYARTLLTGGARRTLWLYPQGVLAPSRAPLAFRSGAARLAIALGDVPIVPVGLRYEQRAEQRPELLVRVGESMVPNDAPGAPSRLTRALESRVQAALDAIDADLARDDLSAYREVLRGSRSLSERWAKETGEA